MTIRTLAAAAAIAGLAPVASAGGVQTGFFADAFSKEGPAVVRGQSADPYYAAPPAGGQPAFGTDPFLPGGTTFPPATGNPFAPGGFGGQQIGPAYGINGPQPYRYGWKEMIDFVYTTPSSTSPDIGDFAWNEANFEKQWVQRTYNGGVFTFAPQYNARWIEGPDGPPGLPGSMHRIGVGLKLGTPVSASGWALEAGFNPAIATDFNDNLTSEAWQFDGHVAAFYRARPTWMWVLGVAYWDRVDDIFLPYAGAVWTPNDYFEARLLFPKARLEWFLGTPYGVPTWLYTTAEYHVESFEISLESPSPATPSQTAMQIEDYRVMGGVRWETGWLETFLEAGVVFERDVEFADAAVPDFEVDTAFMGRVGVKF